MTTEKSENRSHINSICNCGAGQKGHLKGGAKSIQFIHEPRSLPQQFTIKKLFIDFFADILGFPWSFCVYFIQVNLI